MDEENNFLKEQEETVAAENPRTPVADFAFWLRDLGGCASFRGNFVSLDRAKADVIASDAGEAFQSKAKCRDAAKKRVDEAIHEAEQKTECRMSVSGSSSFYQEFRQRFDHRLDALREKLELLRTPENAAVINKIASHLIASEIHRKAKKICGDLSAKYLLMPTSTYYSEISYDAWDSSDYETGVAKLIAKCFMRHGFNCYEVIQSIERDAQTALDSFQADFNAQIQDEILSCIIEPTQQLLSHL